MRQRLRQASRRPVSRASKRAIDAFAGEFADLRREDLIRPLSVGEAEQLFALRFGLEQLRQNFRDLIRAIGEVGGSAAVISL